MSELFREVKESLTTPQVARHLGYEPNQAGFVKSPFKQERTASCKLYEHSFYDFSTNIGGDCVRFASLVLGMDNWQACKYLIEAFSLPISLSGSADHREQIRKRQQEQRRRQEHEKQFKAAWRAEVDRLKYLETIWRFALEHQVFTPLSDHHFRAVKRLQSIRHKLDILCGQGDQVDMEKILAEKRFYNAE